MKELTNDDLDELVDGSVFGDWRGYAREVIEADRFLNAPADRDVMRGAVTEEMVAAYLKASDNYWREMNKWRNGTLREATREGLEAALAAAPTPPAEQQGEQEPVAAILATLRAEVEALHNVSNYDIWFKNQVLALIDKMGEKV